MEYSIQLSDDLKDINIVITKTGLLVETFTDIKQAYVKLKELEIKDYLVKHEGMTFINEYSKVRYNLGLTKDGWYMDCIDYRDNGVSVNCTQRYKNDYLPINKSYLLLYETNELEIIKKTIIDKIKEYEKWANLNDTLRCRRISDELFLLNQKLNTLNK